MPPNSQTSFAAALLDPARGVPNGVLGPDGEASPRRFGVYRNNVTVSLIEAMRAAYPACVKIVGDEFFAGMAREFVRAHPPRTPVMLDYGAGFADFISGFAPAESVPYLADVARVERAWTEAYNAADAAPLQASDLAGLTPEQLPHLRLILHPATRFVVSAHAAISIWEMNIAGEIRPIDISQSEEGLILRPEAEVEVRLVPKGTAAFLSALEAGKDVSKAAVEALSLSPDFDFGAAIGGLLAAGAFTDFK